MDASSASNDSQIASGSEHHGPRANLNGGSVSDIPSNTDIAKTEVSVTSTSSALQAWTDRALHFLSHASNETLGACLVGLAASTYLILGRLGLVLIGLVGGVALHATWEGLRDQEGRSEAQDRERKRRKELGLEVVHRVWQWREKSDTDMDDEEKIDQAVNLVSGKSLDFTKFRPETGAALEVFTTAIIKDYVKWWYSPVLPGEDSFPFTCRQTLTAFLLSLSSHLSRKRPVDTFLDFVTNASSIVIVFLNELSAALNASPNSDAMAALDIYMQLKPDSNLSHVLDPAHQVKKLDMVAKDILQSYLDPKAYDCPPVRVFLQEILSSLVLGMTIESCSKPEWINGWIVYLLEEVEESELMHAIEAGVDSSRNSLSDSKGTTETNPASDNLSRALHEQTTHQRQMSRAEEAMDDAMQEAKRLTQLIAEEEAQKDRETQAAISSSEDVSEYATQGVATPTSSQSDAEGLENRDENKHGKTFSDDAPTFESGTSPSSPTVPSPKQVFTSFDQILPPQGVTALRNADEGRTEPKPVLTLFNAKISIFDDSVPGERTAIRSKPTADYLVQIEPASSIFPGWMIVRKYADLETLHEILRRISVITGTGFTEAHNALPPWKTHTKNSLRGELERYLSDALTYQQLAESEGMKRFLEKDQGLARSPSSNKNFGWPTPSAFDAMGKNMMDVLTKAPKEVAGGGKAFFGGVTNVLGGVKRQSATTSSQNRASVSAAPTYMSDSYMGSIGFERESLDSLRSSPAPMPAPAQRVDSRPSLDISAVSRPSTPQSFKPRPSLPSRHSGLGRPSGELSRSSSYTGTVPAGLQNSAFQAIEETFTLPPPPSLIDEYDGPQYTSQMPRRDGEDMVYSPAASRRTSQPTTDQPPPMPPRPKAPSDEPQLKVSAKPPMTQQETSVTIELLFAVITELYTLSSAWNIRRTLLTAAKTFLLRPGNPQLEAIRVLIQDSLIDTNTSDAGIAAHILKLRENSLPTEEELKKWPAALTSQEKEDLRVKARKLLVEKGMPQALTSVMGAAASGEALGKVFDCLQVESVAKGLIFGLVLQGLRAVVQ